MAVSRRPRPRATLLFLVLLSATVLALDGRSGGMSSGMREGARDAFAPVRSLASTIFDPFGDAVRGVTGYDDLEDDNAELRARVEELEGQRIDGESAVEELRDIRAYIRIEDPNELVPVFAQVVQVPVSNYDQTIELDKGSDDGILEGMPVVTGAGLVGRVVQASGARAVVQLMSDPDSSVGVGVRGSTELGVADGDGAGEPLQLDFIAAGTGVEEGQVVETSGVDGGLYPSGLRVGRVVTSDAPAGAILQSVDVEPFADLDALELVAVLQWQPQP